MTSEALEHAEEMVFRYQERHDRILNQMNSQYLCHREMEEALLGARTDMDEALEFAAGLRRLQMKIICCYPHHEMQRRN
ncbi:hypothetical protein QJS04_geneDACA007312 [Acorus gramineus]|uniref:Shootin-1 n=1 Tax=Acorus gramineus TaxID=55184 RepID=A0AAV9BQH1_ACOGR|nr:hypothetical protein QJS04_geneDACA007312 [Acorus gramineus]